jgi:hypothetical protein
MKTAIKAGIRSNIGFVAIAACALLTTPYSVSALAESAVTLKETELKKEAAIDSPTLATLPGKSRVEVLKRQGGWTQIKPTSELQSQGWVKMFSLKYGDPSTKSDDGSALGSSLFNVARSGSSGTTVTTGVKGLEITKESLQNASPNRSELKLMHGYSVSKAEALQLASSGGLQKQSVPYLGESSSGFSVGKPFTWGE